MPPLRIIVSAAYVDQELSAEFGQIPPAFLPIGVSRLYEAQVTCLGQGGKIYLTIPEGFTPQLHDQRRLNDLNVELVEVPVGLRLGESIVYAINIIDEPPGPVRLLHGDTLIEDLSLDGDEVIAVHKEGDDYSWAAVDLDANAVIGLEVIEAGTGHDNSRPVACGYFALGSSSLLLRAITRARGDFIGGLNLYAKEREILAAPVERWRDFGHIQTYFRSRRAVTTARSFNSLYIDKHKVHKSSADRDKIQAEAAWFGALPSALQPYAARLLDAGDDEKNAAFYEIEYLYAPPLSELFVFSTIGRPTWRNIMESCQNFLDICSTFRGPGLGDSTLADLAIDKTIARLERYAAETGFDVRKPTRFDGRPLPSLLRIAEDMASLIDLTSNRAETIMHGDFCFSNILYNSRSRRIIVIDPRGYVRSGAHSISADIRYDLAKLMHSVVGHYDHIVAGRYALRQSNTHDLAINFETSPHHAWLQDAVAEMQVDGILAGSLTVRAISIGLFLSMLPLHDDRPDRQTAFIANALRLYAALEGVTK